MEKRFFFYGIILNSRNVMKRNLKDTLGIKANFANSSLTWSQFTKMAASGTNKIIVFKRFEKFTRLGLSIDWLQRKQRNSFPYSVLIPSCFLSRAPMRVCHARLAHFVREGYSRIPMKRVNLPKLCSSFSGSSSPRIIL